MQRLVNVAFARDQISAARVRRPQAQHHAGEQQADSNSVLPFTGYTWPSLGTHALHWVHMALAGTWAEFVRWVQKSLQVWLV